jgi:hypothetical protein
MKELTMKKFVMTLAAVALFAAAACALEDNKANREKEADRYLSVMTVRELFVDMAEQVSKNLPEDKRQAFKELFLKYIDMPAVEKAMKASLVKHFSADELKALADFYSSPAGKSAMKKMAAYTADVSPTIQGEVMKAHAKASSESQSEEKPAE